MNDAAALAHVLDRDVLIRAPRELVFTFFRDSAAFARWWGTGSSIDARPGGDVRIVYPGGAVAAGVVLAVDPPARIVFTYGYESGQPIPVGASRVEVELAEVPDGTRVRLRHAFGDAAVRDHHEDGWRYHLSVFARVAAETAHRDVETIADAWFDAWAEPDAERRLERFAACTLPGVVFRDAHSAIEGRSELAAHAGNAQRHMPGLRMGRRGDVRHCQGTALCDWVAAGADGAPFAKGTNVFELAPDGRIASATGLWN
jgi:uncharacterized protein YndB with AHSA1/START domain